MAAARDCEVAPACVTAIFSPPLMFRPDSLLVAPLPTQPRDIMYKAHLPVPRVLGRALALVAILVAGSTANLRAQSVDDDVLLPSRAVSAGTMYTNDSWDHYWEGTRSRTNGNIGTITTRTATFAVASGLTDRLTMIAMLPYVWTKATAGPLRGMQGAQDFQVAAKYRLAEAPAGDNGSLSLIGVVAAAVPASNYTPDFLPLSIGLASRRLSTRLTASVTGKDGSFISATAAHTWRGNVRLDRDSYYTDGQLYSTNEVEMPSVFDYSVAMGIRRGRLTMPFSFTKQRTLGGGDIRRQDMPFVSNRMNFSRIDGSFIYAVPGPESLSMRFGAGRILSGRNVGQSTTFTTGVMYAVHF